ncbi:hypothetical protein COU20_02170 [Candidatus Kaiserbacteria bacterium CG10_big_fil_rev_8_21_14_0_10_59_10]|uniref:Protease PrsW n=1 Tax=Candidatus Kaiserbacteria bacterium CG10_big_fil_rev_8_21_14_0_10_59_10 TaxID=1974612 RepID=A0A2H0U9W9_9BACT|nr:MAG: hypothetical protein COU20_02170 [Candidatus Kaiserbacteria bacterium CG10_big_fil_rev_8_21_14_0_10_59_10]
MPDAVTPVLLAAAGGIFPALAWLWFWRREDAAHPEPRRLIALAFIAGMITVAAVIPIQKSLAAVFAAPALLFAVWSAIEELAKYLAARFSVLWRREVNEPIDVVIYMITVALGFAALENALFLLSPLSGTTTLETMLTGNLRFVGATLLHVLSSAVVGIAIAFAFYKPKAMRALYALVGVILASLLHAGFNFLILEQSEEYLLRTFAIVWFGLVFVLAVIEYVKRIRPSRYTKR